MKKRYLKTIEDIEALRNTDTIIYNARCSSNYLRFVDGTLCQFNKDGKLLRYNATINICGEEYIEVEDEPSEDWRGKLGWFWDEDDEIGTSLCIIDRLDEIDEGRFYAVVAGAYYAHFRPLTPEEVEEYTGYKVVKEV